VPHAANKASPVRTKFSNSCLGGEKKFCPAPGLILVQVTPAGKKKKKPRKGAFLVSVLPGSGNLKATVTFS
jgi:hypothetical protein